MPIWQGAGSSPLCASEGLDHAHPHVVAQDDAGSDVNAFEVDVIDPVLSTNCRHSVRDENSESDDYVDITSNLGFAKSLSQVMALASTVCPDVLTEVETSHRNQNTFLASLMKEPRKAGKTEP